MAIHSENMKDVTTTSFGLVIGYLLPGLMGLYSLTFWFNNVKSISQTFLAAKADLGLTLITLAAALVVGLQINAVRFLIYERVLCRAKKMDANQFKALTEDQKLTVFTTFIEENFRYHQFYGSMTVLLPVLQAGLLKYLNSYIAEHPWFILLTTAFTITLASLFFLLYEINKASAGLKEFLWCYNWIKNLLTKMGRIKTKIIIRVTLVLVVLIYLVWLFLYQGIPNRSSIMVFTLAFSALEVVTGAAAIKALGLYRERTFSILSGRKD